MKNNLIKVVALILTMATGVIMVSGCDIFNGVSETPTTERPDFKGEEVTEGKLIERPKIEEGGVVELLKDLNFSRGFDVTLFHANSSNGNLAGQLDYDGNKADGDSVWRMAQWGCTNDMATEGAFKREGSVITYDDGAKFLRVDTAKTGTVTLGIKGSEEYTRDADGNIRERTDGTENWPHILIEQTVMADTSDCKHLYMEVDYKVTKCESLVDRTLYPLNTSLNAAQFQWFITLADSNPDSESYGEAMWFGFSMFDTRAQDGTPGGLASYDGGKEDSTGLFIYMVSLDAVAKQQNGSVNVPTAVIGKDVSVKIDILPYLKQAIKIARQNGALMGASADQLVIGSTNIGWELPGNYDAEVEISYLNIYKSN